MPPPEARHVPERRGSGRSGWRSSPRGLPAIDSASSFAQLLPPEGLKALQQQHTQPQLLDVHSAPDWLRRPCIHAHYLVGGTPWRALLRTLFAWNNETLNAWTMVWLATLSTHLFITARDRFPGHLAPFLLFWVSCVGHAPLSVGLHCTIGVSAEQRALWRSLDFAGIFTASVVLGASLAWFVFPEPLEFWAYMGASLGVYCFVVYRSMVVRRMRDLTKRECARYVAMMVLTYAVPLLLAAARELSASRGTPGPVCRLVAVITATIVLGGQLYAAGYPERLLPGKFDLLGNSHQLMHVLAMGAHWLEWRLLAHFAAHATY